MIVYVATFVFSGLLLVLGGFVLGYRRGARYRLLHYAVRRSGASVWMATMRPTPDGWRGPIRLHEGERAASLFGVKAGQLVGHDWADLQVDADEMRRAANHVCETGDTLWVPMTYSVPGGAATYLTCLTRGRHADEVELIGVSLASDLANKLRDAEERHRMTVALLEVLHAERDAENRERVAAARLDAMTPR